MKTIKTLQQYSFYDGECTYLVTENTKYNSFCIARDSKPFNKEEATKVIDRYFDLIMATSLAREHTNISDFYDCVYSLNKSKNKIIIKAYKGPRL